MVHSWRSYGAHMGPPELERSVSQPRRKENHLPSLVTMSCFIQHPTGAVEAAARRIHRVHSRDLRFPSPRRSWYGRSSGARRQRQQNAVAKDSKGITSSITTTTVIIIIIITIDLSALPAAAETLRETTT